MALLLRRLKDHVVGDQGWVLQCITTSIPLGKGEAAYPRRLILQQGSLTNHLSEWVARDSDRKDVVRATRQPLRVHEVGEWSPALPLYGRWQKLIADANFAESDPDAHAR